MQLALCTFATFSFLPVSSPESSSALEIGSGLARIWSPAGRESCVPGRGQEQGLSPYAPWLLGGGRLRGGGAGGREIHEVRDAPLVLFFSRSELALNLRRIY